MYQSATRAAFDSAKPLTNTERLIATLEHAEKYGDGTVIFNVGKYTGNGPSVVAALKKRGFDVSVYTSGGGSYVLKRGNAK